MNSIKPQIKISEGNIANATIAAIKELNEHPTFYFDYFINEEERSLVVSAINSEDFLSLGIIAAKYLRQ